jgi:putative membrane-bound dehydrogenase-like protein
MFIRSAALIFVFAFGLVALAADDRPYPANEAAAHMSLPPSFRATLFAGEPDVVQPIAFTFDDRGRLWVVECYSYPNWTKDGAGHDRVLIFEDTKGEGRFDKRTVFWDKGANLSGIQVGFSGVWLCSTPNLLFIPVKNGDDSPAGPPEIVLDGWNLKEAGHNVFNGLEWGPDGWLYGCNGIQSKSLVGKPGTPDKDRVAINCGVWRYHPTRKVFEAYAHGTTNPWGLDWDDYGELFITNCVIDHIFHVVPNGHYERMYGQDFNPHAYGLMKGCCDHRHWAGGPWQAGRANPENSDFGGGHAHAGLMIYLGDNFPPEYRNSAFMCNIHGNRVNRDPLERVGSGYVAHHGKDFLLANDAWFRGLGVHSGPDGGVYVSDWCDTGECHNADRVDRTNGRIYKVVYGTPKPWHGDLAKLSDAELVKLQTHPNDWFVRHARRLLQERAASGKLNKDELTPLQTLLDDLKADVRHRLRALWALQSTGALSAAATLRLAKSPAMPLAVWAVRLYFDVHRVPFFPPSSADVTESPKDLQRPEVQLSFASGLQWVSPRERVGDIEFLLGAVSDRADFNLKQMAWLAIEPLVADQPGWAILQLNQSDSRWVRECIARRMALLTRRSGDKVTGLDVLSGWLTSSDDSTRQADVLAGIQAAFLGRRTAPMPTGWAVVYHKLLASRSSVVSERARQLAVLFGDEQALSEVRGLVTEATVPTDARRAALRTLQQRQRPDLVPVLHRLLADRELRGQAIAALAAFDDPATPAQVIQHYPSFTDTEKAAAIATLSARPSYARALLDAVEKGVIPPRDVSAHAVRQLQGLKDPALTARAAKVWGSVKATSEEKKIQIARYKSMLTPVVLNAADRSAGRAVFAKSCASCHRLFDDGGKIGPELTGSQRANLDYILENIVDPNALVPREYRVTRFMLTSGRSVDGIVVKEDTAAVTIQTPTEQIVVPKGEIAERDASEISLMPEGLLAPLTREQVRDLIAYLGNSKQVPLPK